MKTVLIRKPGGPEVLELADLPIPEPRRGEVLIRTRAMGVSRPDVLIRKGVYSWMPPLPVSPGNELTGTIEAAGEGAALRPGQAVLLSARDLPVRGGCYTEFVAVPAGAVHPLPDGVDLDQAVVLPTYLVAYALLHDMGFRRGARTIFVTGASGAIGGALCELAKAEGLEVIGTAGSEDKAAHARAMGADHVIDYRAGKVVERVMELTGGRGVDLVFDHMIGRDFTDFLKVLADFGSVVFYNIHAEMPAKDLFREMCEAASRSPAVRLFNMHTYDHAPEERRRLTRAVIDMLAASRIDPRIGKRLPMAEAAEAHRLLESGSIIGKIVLHP